MGGGFLVVRARSSPLALLLLLVLAVAGPLPGLLPTAAAAPATVAVANFDFSPATVTINVGEDVTWHWTSGFHSVVRDGDGATLCASRSAPAADCTVSFQAVGTVAYHCGVHPSMTARVVVASPTAVTIASPAPGADVSGLATVSGAASAPGGIARVQYRLDGGPLRDAAGTSSWSFAVDTTLLPNGPHSVQVVATPFSGPVGEATLDVRVANTPTLDLAVVAVQGAVGAGGSTTIIASVENHGNSASQGAVAVFEFLSRGTWHPIGSTPFGVAGFGSSLVGVTWRNPTLVGSFPVRVTVGATGPAADFDASNNAAQGRAAFWTDAIAGQDLLDPDLAAPVVHA